MFTIFGPDDWCSTKEYLASLNVNTLGAVRVCHNFLPLIKKSKVESFLSCVGLTKGAVFSPPRRLKDPHFEGRVVTMGSTAGRLHGLYVGPYVTAKFAVEAYMDCLRLEMRPFGVSVHILEPGAFKTELLSEQAQHARVNKVSNCLNSHSHGMVSFIASLRNITSNSFTDMGESFDGCEERIWRGVQGKL